MKKKTKIIIAVIAALVLIGIIGQALEGEKDPAPTSVQPTAAKEWKDMQYEERAAWIKGVLKQHNSHITESEVEMSNAIKSQFNYPEEVDFNFGEYPLFTNGDVVDADTGFVFFHGGGTAKNAFGVKSRFVYQVRTVIRPDTMYIDNISVSEPK